MKERKKKKRHKVLVSVVRKINDKSTFEEE